VAGSTFRLDATASGVISLNITFGTPIDVVTDTNMLAFVFDPLELDINAT